MPHSDAIPTPQPLNDQHARIRAAFVARLKPGAHLLNGQCGTGEDLCWLRTEGYVVTACEEVLADARVASQQAGQAVRVCAIAQLHSVLPYDGIWLSRPLDGEAATLATQLQQLTTLLKPGAPLALPLLPTGGSRDQGTRHLLRLIAAAALPLQLAISEPGQASPRQDDAQYILLRGDHPAP